MFCLLEVKYAVCSAKRHPTKFSAQASINTPFSPNLRSSFDWNTAPYAIPDLYSKAGTPCDQYRGYCDVFRKCREVSGSGDDTYAFWRFNYK